MIVFSAFISPFAILHRSQLARTCLPNNRLSIRPRQSLHPPLRTRRFTFRAASALPSTSITPGTLLEFRTSNNDRQLARVLRPDGKRNWFVEDTSGRSISISSKQITFVVGHPSQFPDLETDLNTLSDKASLKAESCADLLETAWEIVSFTDVDKDPVIQRIDQISDIIMDESSALAQFATHILLNNNKKFFKEKIVSGVVMYQARTRDNVMEIQAFRETKNKLEQQTIQRHTAILTAYEQRNFASFCSELGNDADDFFHNVQQMALELEKGNHIDFRYGSSTNSFFHQLSSSQKALVKDVFSALSLPIIPSSALRLLIALRVFKPHENLTLLNAQIPSWHDIDNTTRAAIERLLHDSIEDVDEDRRVDLTNLSAVAIDSADTSEVDDAFSWDPSSETIYAHIADPLRYFPAGIDDVIVQQAMQRTSTIYLPYTKLTMFPEEIASRLLSLNGDLSDGSSLSFSFRLHEDGRIVNDSMQVQLTTISKPIRMTYEEAEVHFLKGDDRLSLMMREVMQRMQQRRNWREMEGGAILINTPICNVTVRDVDKDEPDVSLEAVNTNSVSWLTVSELMITASLVGATLASKHDIIMPFRGQEPFDYPPDEVLDRAPDGPVRAALAFRNASPTVVGVEPMEHATLGLDNYVQVTSPIRRSLDLVAHVQLKAWLRNERDVMLSSEKMLAEISRTQSVIRSNRLVENKTTRYWQLEYLRRCAKDSKFEGVFLRYSKEANGRLGIIFLYDLSFTISVEVWSGAKIGDQVEVEIRSVDVRSGVVKGIGQRNHDLAWQENFDDETSEMSQEWLAEEN